MDRDQTQPLDAATTVDHAPEANAAPGPLEIDSGLLAAIHRHLRDWLPNEGCGLLASVRAGERDRAVHFFPGTNVDYSPVRYTMDPAEVIAAMKHMRQENWQLAAIVHSHPRTRPAPSRTDQQEWYYPEARLLIVSFAGDEPEIGCWALVGDRQTREFRRAPLLVDGR
ncbi:MAG TPA: M67 family metallopeptidase [Thermomicrobiales bacterium]|nr:M67 family metallopeptidase [Thermomicrobiales bacterium]